MRLVVKPQAHQPTATPTMYKTDPTKLGVAGKCELLKNWIFERKPNCIDLSVICYCKGLFLVEFHVFLLKKKREAKRQ